MHVNTQISELHNHALPIVPNMFFFHKVSCLTNNHYVPISCTDDDDTGQPVPSLYTHCVHAYQPLVMIISTNSAAEHNNLLKKLLKLSPLLWNIKCVNTFVSVAVRTCNIGPLY